MAKKGSTALALVPAAARTSQVLRRGVKIHHSVQTALTKFESELGGRQSLIEALSSGELTQEVKETLQIIADPRFDGWSLARICQKTGIIPGQLFHAVKMAALSRAHVIGMVEAAKQLPTIVNELLVGAVTHETTCTACNGTGTKVNEPSIRQPNPQPYLCPTCIGLGKLTIPGDLEHQKLALELTQLLKKSGGINILNQNTQQAPTNASTDHMGSLEQLQQSVSDYLYGRRRPALADPVGADDPIIDAVSEPVEDA